MTTNTHPTTTSTVTITRPIPGQTLEAIPENWEHSVVRQRPAEQLNIEVYRVPESDVWVRAKHGETYYIDAVSSSVDVKHIGDIAAAHEVREFADEYEQKYDGPENAVTTDAKLIREISQNWDAVERELKRAVKWTESTGLFDTCDVSRSVDWDSDGVWVIEFGGPEPIFRFLDAVRGIVDRSNYEMPDNVLRREFRDADLIPHRNTFKIKFDESPLQDEYYIRGLIEAGASPAEALDYLMTDIKGMTQTEWADERGVDQSTVSEHVSATQQRSSSGGE